MTNLPQQAYYSQFTNKRNKAVQVRWVAQNLNPDILNTCSLYHTVSQGTRALFIPNDSYPFNSFTNLSRIFIQDLNTSLYFPQQFQHLPKQSIYISASEFHNLIRYEDLHLYSNSSILDSTISWNHSTSKSSSPNILPLISWLHPHLLPVFPLYY